MRLPEHHQDVTPESLSTLEVQELLDLYVWAWNFVDTSEDTESTAGWTTVKQAIQTEIERRISEGRKP